MKILITGAAGFIGFHLSKKCLDEGFSVVGLDSINNYYDINLKKSRLKQLNKFNTKNLNKFNFVKQKLENLNKLEEIFKKYNPQIVINLAAQAGVRFSIENPHAYINSNIVGFVNILECVKKYNIEHFLYASSSSVYGGNINLPFSEKDSVDHPISLYAATKKSNELIAHSYSHLFNIPATGMRFFTVYGPWGRPDMAPMIFANAIMKNNPIEIFNHGKMSRSFSYIDDVIEVIEKLIDKPAYPDSNFNTYEPKPATSWCPHRIFNIGNKNKFEITEFIECLEKELGKKAIKIYKGMQPGDVKETLSDNSLINSWLDNISDTSLAKGISEFVKWYLDFYD